MATLDWGKVCGQEFTLAEARAVSDFEEIIHNFGLSPDDAYKLFGRKELNVAQRLFFAAKMSIDEVAGMLLFEDEQRLRAVIQDRLSNERKLRDGGIIL